MSTAPENASKRRDAWCFFLLLILTLATVLWIWGLVCLFPSSEWNNVRLRPSFLLATGHSFYEGASGGPINTWMYGPLLPFLLLPATLASSTTGALLVAAFLNTAMIIATPAFACGLWPHPLSIRERWLVFVATLLATSKTFFIFLCADSLAIMLGMLGMLALQRAKEKGVGWLWIASAMGVAAAASKQTAISVLIAQIIYLGLTRDWKAAIRHFARCGILAGGTACLIGWLFGFEAAWLKLIHIPARLPFSRNISGMLYQLAPFLLAYAGMLWLLWRRARKNEQGALLVLLTGVCALPLGLASFLRAGGGINSLHGYLLMLPFCLLELLAWLKIALPRMTPKFPLSFWPGAAIITVALAASPRWVETARLPRQPMVAAIHEAEALAKTFPGEIWFPWSPLISFYSEGRHYHDEDGLYVRQESGVFPRREVAYGYLPPKWRITALHRTGVDTMNWGVALSMQQTGPTTQETFGDWTLVINQSQAPAVP